jgi:aquaporin Z
MKQKLIIEFLGTFFLVLVVALTGNPVAIGAVLIALVYMGGYISGAHYNPAVTLALWVNDKVGSPEALRFIATQLLAGIAAAAVYFFIHGSSFVPHIGENVSLVSASLIEMLFTFLLCTVIFHVAVATKTRNNQYFGAAIGLTLLVAAAVGGPISGGAFNPAVGVSPLLFDITHLVQHKVELMLYLLGPTAGGLLAAYVYRLTK